MFNGKIILKMLEERGYTKSQLIEGIGLNKAQTSIGRIVEGNPSARRLEAVADFFHCSIDTFFTREVELPAPTETEQVTSLKSELNETKKDLEVRTAILKEMQKRIDVMEAFIKVLQSQKN